MVSNLWKSGSEEEIREYLRHADEEEKKKIRTALEGGAIASMMAFDGCSGFWNRSYAWMRRSISGAASLIFVFIETPYSPGIIDNSTVPSKSNPALCAWIC
jgi:hypothetical protein